MMNKDNFELRLVSGMEMEMEYKLPADCNEKELQNILIEYYNNKFRRIAFPYSDERNRDVDPVDYIEELKKRMGKNFDTFYATIQSLPVIQ